MRKSASPALLALAATVAAFGAAGAPKAAPPDDRRWGVGLEAIGLAVPGGHLGLAADNGHAIAAEVVGRYQPWRFAAIKAGLGVPHPGMGVGGWLSGEIFAPVVANGRKTLVLSLFQESGLQLGYAGPDYFARHGDDFVGYRYASAGPLAFALRFPAGVCLRWAGGYLDSYAEVVPIIALTPAREVLYDVTFGTRVRF